MLGVDRLSAVCRSWAASTFASPAPAPVAPTRSWPVVAIAAALGSNLIVKTVLAFTAGGRRFGLGFLSCMAAPAALFGVATAVVTAALPQ